MNIAILVASENYANPDNKLTSPSKDLELLKNTLEEYCKYDIYIPFLIKDGEAHNGFKLKIKDIFSSFSGNDIENFLFYFSGHGRYEAGNGSVLCLNDNEYLEIREVAEWVNSLSPESSYIIVDACHAGNKVIDKYEEFANDDSLGFFGIFASTPTTYAYANSHISFFTKTFCDALDDYSNYTNNELSASTIYEYIHNIFKTRNISQRISIQQAQKDVQTFAFWNKPVPYCKAPIVDPLYIERSDENSHIDNLLNKRTLLLCGDTKVGKTYLSLSLAKKLWKQGYDFMQTNDLDKARNFLSLTDHPRVCLLDDPYGAWKTLSDSNRHKTVLDIILNKPISNLLIITSRKDIVLEIFGRNDLEHCKECSLNWQEIDSEKEVLLQSWCNYAYSIDLNESIINAYIEYISSPMNILTIGNLKAITAMTKNNIEQKPLQDIVHLSHIEASEQAGKYLNSRPQIWNICSILALTCSTIDSVTFDDIRFILYNKLEYPSIEVRKESSIKISNLYYEAQIPEYKNLIEIGEEISRDILWLEQQNVIQIIDNRIKFTHPYHQEVCIYMLSNLNTRRINALILYLQNSLNCLNPDAAYICSKNIKYIMSSEDSLCKAFLDVPMAYLQKPIYPKVRDAVLRYFTSDKIIMSPEEIEEFAGVIANGTSLYVYWNGDIPFYDDYSFTHELGLEKLTIDEYTQGIETINRKAFISPKLLNQLLLYNINNKVLFEQDLFETAIWAEEGFLKTAAVKYLFYYLNIIDDSLFLYLLTNSTRFLLPDSSFKAVESCFNSFHKVNERLKIGFQKFILNIFKRSDNCLRCSRLILNFTIDYGSVEINWRNFNDEQRLELWTVWRDVFPVFLSNMHPKLASYLMSGRYSRTLMDFMEKVTPDEYIAVFKSILQFYKLQIKSDSFNHSDQLTAISIAIEATINSPESRKDIILEILDLSNEDVTYHIISVCSVHWKYLRDDEREIVKSLVSKNDNFAGLVLFNPNCPVELLNCITKNDLLGFDEVQGILSTLSTDALDCCIDVFTGKRILTNYYYNRYEKNTFVAKCLIYLFSNENKKMYDITSTLLYHNLMTVELWFKISNSTLYKNELANSLSDLFDSGYNIKDYDKYWLLLFSQFVTEGREDEFAESFFYSYIRLRKRYPETSNESLEKQFSQTVISYYNSKRYEDIFKNTLERVERENMRNI